jgi:hypothetical protein
MSEKAGITLIVAKEESRARSARKSAKMNKSLMRLVDLKELGRSNIVCVPAFQESGCKCTLHRN